MQTQSTRGTTLRAVRLSQGRSLRSTAGQAGIDPGYLSKVERGQKQLSVDSLYRLALVLELRDLARLLTPYVTPVEKETA